MKPFHLFSSPLLFVCLPLFLFNVPVASAQNDILDPTFGNNGTMITSLNESGYDDFAQASAMQANGKTIVAGYSYTGPNGGYGFDATLFRFNEDGKPDSSFGNNGRVIIDINNSDDYLFDIALQPDGKIIVAGGSDNILLQQSRLLVIRLLPNGAPDSSFADNGFFGYINSIYNESLQSICILADGKILAAGFNSLSNDPLFLLRLTDNGILDADFGNGGIKDETSALDETKIDMAIDNDNRILLCGTTPYDSWSAFGTERYTSDGVPDSTFGTNGLAIVDFGTADDEANAISLQADGKIVLTGSSGNPAKPGIPKRVALCRLSNDGDIDPSFGIDGKVITDFDPFQSRASSLLITPDQKILAAGTWENEAGDHAGFLMLLYRTNGSLDTSFGSLGLAQTDAVVELQTNTAVHQTSGQKIIFSSFAQHGISGNDFLAARFEQDGGRDLTFGMNATAWGNLTPVHSSSLANDMILIDGGALITAGNAQNQFTHGDFLVSKYTPEGMPDLSFGQSGFIRLPVDDNYYEAFSVNENGDGSLIVGGIGYYGYYYKAVVMKLQSNGNTDLGFADHGILKTNFGFPGAHLNKTALQPDGKIVGCGTVNLADDSTALLLFRLKSDGTPDSTFNGNGMLVYDREHDVTFENLNDLTILNDGSILACGNLNHPSLHDTSIVMKILPDGAFDNSFGNGGVITFTHNFYDYVNAMAVQPDGSIVVAGTTNGVDDDFLAYRFLADGNPDLSFGQNGLSIIADENYIERTNDVGLLSDGRIALTGFQQSTITNNPDFALLMLSPSGQPDSTFDDDGWASVDLPGFGDDVFCLAVQPDDKVILGGLSYPGFSGWNLSLARFTTSVGTGIQSFKFPSDELTLYPNPANDVIQFENPLITTASEKMIASIKNIYGKTLITTSFDSHKNRFELPLNNIANGVYILELSDGKKLWRGKFVKD